MKLYLCLVYLVAGVSTFYDGQPKMDRLSRVTSNWAERLQAKIQLTDMNSTASPLGIHRALVNLFLGARGNTSTEMGNMLELPRFTGGATKPHEAYSNIFEEYRSLNQSVSQVLCASYISVPSSYSLLPKFLNKTATYYPETKVDFHDQTDPLTIEQKINDHIKNKTGGHITDIVKPGSLSSGPGIILADALFVSLIWSQPFLTRDILRADFHINSTTTIKMDIMYDDYRHMKIKTNYFGADMAELETIGGRFSAFFLMPHKGNSIANLEKTLAEGNNSNSLFENMTLGPVEFCVPRFRFESLYELSSPLKEMGMDKAFNPALADFSAFSRTTGAHLRAHHHKSVLEINENGTAAVPAAEYKYHTGFQIGKVLLDRPFIVFLRDNQRGIILIQGKFWGK